MEKKYRLITENGRILLGGEAYNRRGAERWYDDLGGVCVDEETGKEERIYLQELKNEEGK